MIEPKPYVYNVKYLLYMTYVIFICLFTLPVPPIQLFPLFQSAFIFLFRFAECDIFKLP